MSGGPMQKWKCGSCLHSWVGDNSTCPRCEARKRGWIINQLNAAELARHISALGKSEEVMKALASLYGMEVKPSEQAAYVLDLVCKPEMQLGLHIARCITKANLPDSHKWWCYSVTFRLHAGEAQVAWEGLVEHDK